LRSASSDGILVSSFFFFQAEDGIRDLTVTGVQTCALPICPMLSWKGLPTLPILRLHMIGGTDDWQLMPTRASFEKPRSMASLKRSEERRVGKECRSRGSRYHGTKNVSIIDISPEH